MALGISTSGNSPNIVRAMEAAAEKGMKRVALTGQGGGKLKDQTDLCLMAPSDHTPVIQEVHLWLEHIVCQYVDEILFGSE